MSMDKLKQEVAEAVTVMGGAATLIGALRARVKQVQDEAAGAGVDLASLDALANDLDTNANALAEAMKENTEAAAEPPAPVPEAPVDPDAGAGEASGETTPPADETSTT